MPCPSSYIGGPEFHRVSILEQVIAENYGNTPEALCKLLFAIAGGEMAKKAGHDTILISAAEMIKAFERRTRNAT